MKKLSAIVLLIFGGLAACLAIAALNYVWCFDDNFRDFASDEARLILAIPLTIAISIPIEFIRKLYHNNWGMKTWVFYMFTCMPSILIFGASFIIIIPLARNGYFGDGMFSGVAQILAAFAGLATAILMLSGGAIGFGISSIIKRLNHS